MLARAMRAPCLVALCLLTWLSGGSFFPSVPAARAAPTAELRGRVMQRGSIVGVEAARIIVRAAPAADPIAAPVAPPPSSMPAPSEAAAEATYEATYEATADRRGRFTLTVPSGPIAVTVQAAGHELLQARETLRPGESRRVEYLVKALPSYRRPFEVTVRGAPKAEGQRLSLRGEELRTLPGTLGDPFRAIGLLPGVATPLPVLPVYVVRGASPGMNGFFLDGMRVPQLFHVLVGGGVALIQPVEGRVSQLSPAGPGAARMALSDWLNLGLPRGVGVAGAVLAGAAQVLGGPQQGRRGGKREHDEQQLRADDHR